MATKIRDAKLLPDNAHHGRTQIDAMGFRWEFDYQYPLLPEDQVQRVQVRDQAHNAPTQEVTKYAQAMKRGDKFPPGIVTKDGRYVDFNTRAKAAYRNGMREYPVFILDINYDTAAKTDKDRVHLLMSAMNMKHGRRLDRHELAAQIKRVASDTDWTAEQVAKRLGVATGTVNGIFAQLRGYARAEQLGVPFNGAVTMSNVQMLGQKGDKLTDGPFRELCLLVQDTGMTGSELRNLLAQVQATARSDAEKVAVIQTERESRDPQIRNYKATGRKKPPLAVTMRRHLGFVLEHEARIDELVDYSPVTGAEYLEKLDRAGRILGLVIEAQERQNDEQTRQRAQALV